MFQCSSIKKNLILLEITQIKQNPSTTGSLLAPYKLITG